MMRFFVFAIPFILPVVVADNYQECDCHRQNIFGVYEYNWELTYNACTLDFAKHGRYNKATGRCERRPFHWIEGKDWIESCKKFAREGYTRVQDDADGIPVFNYDLPKEKTELDANSRCHYAEAWS
ncbi:hypothetical protein Ptr902_10906 [Pyrenophora tritici-repentis]|uniref:Uncharacterized protein n=1 Tax=Pyrenophora tritici-repentis TaxID=45151 RepID=A0A5M9KWY6_9PLEO|nr:hypothetical protein PtrV1_11889 [Pyrenophora tritici-repentis]KAF7444681.1 hypothetical protein A1F99_112340 [Pyrenophora tritici-repentis]KAF7564657.1 hypothetical protein PtrM4_040910 [Pyrenophora tritici-repentis]KAI0574343.1 hypothetical protein Alg215_08649 [Pyrenophora tritici-repentis]KAI0579320.1 hypothetical protein Alg130_07558 [Pyrenophora tritici-repentis]